MASAGDLEGRLNIGLRPFQIRDALEMVHKWRFGKRGKNSYDGVRGG